MADKPHTDNAPSLLSAPPQPHRGPTWYEELPHDSYYYTGFWGSYKGAWKGGLGGIIIGAILGTAIGLAAAGAAVIAAPAILTATTTFWTIASSFALIFGAAGSIKGFHEFSMIGSNAGVGVALDELEVRQNRNMDAKLNRVVKKFAALMGKEKDLPAISAAIDSESDTVIPTREYSSSPHVDSATAPTTSIFHGKVGLLGLALGIGVGALICAAALPAAGAAGAAGVLSLIGIHAIEAHATATAVTAGTAAIMTACGMFGASFGLDRIVFRRVFDFTDKLFAGRVLPKNLVASSHNHKVSRSAAPEIPTIPQPAISVEPSSEAPAQETKNQPQREWAEKIRAEQALTSFDHTRAPMH